MIIYKQEIIDGLADQLRASACVTLDLEIDESVVVTTPWLKSSASELKDEDLYGISSILASVGWNKNDDVLDKYEAWKARNTPVNKPFNYMHNERDIIGHIIASRAIDFSGNVIDSSIAFDDIPDEFDIVVDAVVYRHLKTHSEERMRTLIDEIAQGKWCVSMEALFPTFDYAIVTPDGDDKILARNTTTSFLTKHLRCYGGKGEFQGYKLGRLLRNITFAGKGLVTRPGNPRSIVLKQNRDVASFHCAATLNEFKFNTKENVMSDSLQVSKAEYDALKQERDEALAKVEAAAKEKADADKAKLDSLTSELTKANEIVKSHQAQVAKALEEEAAAKAELAKANEEINKMKLEATNAKRLVQLTEAGVENTKATELVAQFASVSDEQFTSLVSTFAEFKKDEKKDKKDEKKDPEHCDASENVTPDEQSLETTQADVDPSLNQPSDNPNETILAKASEWIRGELKSTPKNKKE
jgi:hypothetical protein